MPLLCLLVAVLLLGSLSAGAPAVPKAPPGFQVELLLQAPDIEAPTALAVHPGGDVYLAEDPMDMRGPTTRPIDRIWLLPGGDPRKKVLFAEKLWAVMGLEIVRDRLYCVHPPYVTVFHLGKDGRAVRREELFTDLGPRVAGLPSFNDHVASGIRMGIDGWLYVSIGDKGIPRMSRKEKDRGSWHVAEGRWRWSKEGQHISLEGGGVIRFRPDGTGLEVFASGTRNHLDVPLDEHDRIVVRDNTDDGLGWNTRLMYLPRFGFLGYPWAYRHRNREHLPAIADYGSGSPCGGWVYLDDGLPATYRGRVFHCEWGKGKVLAVQLRQRGASFVAGDEIAFLDPSGTAVKDFRPFTIRPTADGRGFYVTDWGYSGWLAKVKAGRLWKITYTGSDVKPRPRGRDEDAIDRLIEALGHPAHSERVRAQRALQARRDAQVKKLATAAALNPKTSPLALRHLVWVVGPGEVTLRALGHPSSAVRLEAARVLAPTERVSDPGLLPLVGALAALLEDEDPRVRLEAITALGHFPGIDEALVHSLVRETDPLLLQALAQALRQMSPWKKLASEDEYQAELFTQATLGQALLPALSEVFEPSAVALLASLLRHRDAALRAAVVTTLASNFKQRKPYAGGWWGTQPAAQKPPAREIAWAGTAAVRQAILSVLTDRSARVRHAVVAALVGMNDPETLDPLVRQFARETDASTRADIVRAISGLGTPHKVGFLATLAREPRQDTTLRLEAVAGLASGDPAVVSPILGAIVLRESEPTSLRVRALLALGTFRRAAVKSTLAGATRSAMAAVRSAAAQALGQLGDPAVATVLIPLLEDSDPSVRVAAIRALGAVSARSAIPALMRATTSEATRFDAIRALAAMPDPRALTAYLSGLGSKSPTLRQECRTALGSIRTRILKPLEELIRRGEVRGDLLPELRAVYQAPVPILTWSLIGPFPADERVHGPVKEFKADAAYPGAGKQVKWRLDHQADAKQHGRVRLDVLFSPNTDVVAYGRAEVISERERQAELRIGSDDSIILWLNGKRVHAFTGQRGWAANQDRVVVSLRKGTNTFLVQCGNRSGGWDFSVAISGDADRYPFLQGGKRKLELDDFRAFARKNRGDAARGARLFADLKGLACIKCHAVNGTGGKVGPDLAGIGLKYRREELMTSILEPSRVIAQGYETVVVTTVRGTTLQGVFKGENADAVHLADAEGKAHQVAKKEIEERSFSQVSLMPNGLNEGMTLQDFADLLAYLEARREDQPAGKPPAGSLR